MVYYFIPDAHLAEACSVQIICINIVIWKNDWNQNSFSCQHTAMSKLKSYTFFHILRLLDSRIFVKFVISTNWILFQVLIEYVFAYCIIYSHKGTLTMTGSPSLVFPSSCNYVNLAFICYLDRTSKSINQIWEPVYFGFLNLIIYLVYSIHQRFYHLYV